MIKQKLIFILFLVIFSVNAFSLDISPSVLQSSTQIQDDKNKSKFKQYFFGTERYFKISAITDPLILATSLAATIINFSFRDYKADRKFDSTTLNINDVNQFDRWAMKPYSRPLDITASVLQGAVFASPLLFGVVDMRDWVTIGVMYAEVQLLSQVTKSLIKSLVYRPRPYSYFDNPPQKYIDSGDWNNSFPSGHTFHSFAAASFTSFVFLTYFPNSLWNIPVTLGAYSIAATVGILRILSGNHFLSDVLVGAALGTVIGIGVPLLHRIGTNKNTDSIANNKVSVAASPLGFTATIRF